MKKKIWFRVRNTKRILEWKNKPCFAFAVRWDSRSHSYTKQKKFNLWQKFTVSILEHYSGILFPSFSYPFLFSGLDKVCSKVCPKGENGDWSGGEGETQERKKRRTTFAPRKLFSPFYRKEAQNRFWFSSPDQVLNLPRIPRVGLNLVTSWKSKAYKQRWINVVLM